ncbi:MAG: IPT/TIG domain-containing protein, partial [Microthrixaceae bacterium]
MHKSIVATLLLVLIALAASPAGAAGDTGASSTLPSTLDLDGAALRFAAVGQVVEPAELVEAPMALGQSLTYRDVVTVDGYVVDAVISVVAVENLLDDVAEYTDENNDDPVLDGEIEADANASPSTPGRVIYRMAFYHGDTYSGPGSGVPVTLLGLRVHVYDVDNLQFAEFSGFAGYQLSTNTILTVTPGTSGRTRFAETNNTSTNSSSGTAYTRGRVTVRFDAVASFEYAYGVIEAEDGASYSVDLSADGEPWTDNVGGAAAPEVANPTLTLSSVGPTSGSTAGGQTVTLRGAGFVAGTTVRFGASACSSVVVVSATELTCVTPAGADTVDVSVRNPDSSTASLPAAYTYVVAPAPAPDPAPTPTPSIPTPTVPATPALQLSLDLGVDGTLNGNQIVVSGEGLQPNTIVSIRLEPGGVVLGQATVGADGTFRTTVTVPAGLADGTYEVVADGVAADGSPVSVRGTFVIRAGAAAPAALAFTGSSSWSIAIAGVL